MELVLSLRPLATRVLELHDLQVHAAALVRGLDRRHAELGDVHPRELRGLLSAARPHTPVRYNDTQTRAHRHTHADMHALTHTDAHTEQKQTLKIGAAKVGVRAFGRPGHGCGVGWRAVR